MGFGPSWPQNTGRGRGRRGRSQGFSLGPNRNAARTVALILLGIAAAAISRCAPAIVEGSIDGRPRLVDGDSFFMGQTEVRMQGIDAPEGRQTCTREGRDWRCGEEAKRTLQRLTGGQPIRCDIHSTDQHGRKLATCFSASGANLNAAMVAEGYAVAFGAYESEERQAKSARRGIWGAEFERPQDWRRRNNGGS
ncbi:MAG: nuclease [Hyphomicrobium sp.]|nr:nuclease [Hyphomicrobium sp.]PPD08261.1 MAG: nuclease [Hyphomicrobium sp.]